MVLAGSLESIRAFTMKITTIRLDLAKSVFQAHGIDETGASVLVKRLHRKQMLPCRFSAGTDPGFSLRSDPDDLCFDDQVEIKILFSPFFLLWPLSLL